MNDSTCKNGYIAHNTGDHRRAIRYYEQAYTLYQDLTNTYFAADTLDRLSHAHPALDHHNNARFAWQQALLLYQEQERKHDANRIQRQLDAEILYRAISVSPSSWQSAASTERLMPDHPPPAGSTCTHEASGASGKPGHDERDER
jgi:tetratricopeptide (TPR) repeat protein